jgi:hypothetical protein
MPASDPERTMIRLLSATALAAALALPAAAPPAAAGAEGFVPFPVEWPREAVQSPADLSFLLDAPAGKYGFVDIENGHLVLPLKRRFRIWGVNITGGAAFPKPDEAAVAAAHIARLGVNCVRFHFLDTPWALLDAKRDDTRALDAEKLERLDRFVAELKKRGVYSNLNLNVGRRYTPGDGVREADLLGVGKGATYFDPRLIELQKEYARQLLTHVNPHTGAAYAAEPAVALVELVNENSLVESWFAGRLRGAIAQKPSDVWSDVPASYAAQLTERYTAWLAANRTPEEVARIRAEAGAAAGAPVPRLDPGQFGKASKERFQAEASFYMDVERGYFKEMARFLREDLKVRVPIAGSSDHSHGKSGYPHVAGLATLDVVDGHVYWQHPSYVRDPGGKKTGFRIANTPMVDDPLNSTVVQLARTAVAGKPYTVSEFNHPFPNEYAAEGLPILAGYAAFQDWDGLFAYTFAHDDLLALKPYMKGHFDHAKDPVKVPQLAAGALLFLRGDVRSALETAERTYTREQVFESLRLPGAERPLFTPGMPRSLPLRKRVRVRSFDGPATGPFEADPGEAPVRSDTGELAWRSGAKRTGLVTVDAACSQALVGFVAAGKGRTRHLDGSALAPEFCAVTLGSLDGKPVAESERLLLTAGARVANAGMAWDAKRTTLEAWGTAPSEIEPVTGPLRLPGLAGAKAVELQPLDGAGRPMGAPVPAARDGDAWSLTLGKPATTWGVVRVQR